MKIKAIVKRVLKEHPETRNSDIKLLNKIGEIMGCTIQNNGKIGINLECLGNPEHYTRARRKIQETNEELKANTTIEIARNELGRKYKRR